MVKFNASTKQDNMRIKEQIEDMETLLGVRHTYRGRNEKQRGERRDRDRSYNNRRRDGAPIRTVTSPQENDIWTIPNLLLPSLQQHPWVRYLLVRDGSWVFPGLLLNPPFSIWEECALYFLDIAERTGRFFLVIAPDQEKYEWHERWYKERHGMNFTRIDLQTPLKCSNAHYL